MLVLKDHASIPCHGAVGSSVCKHSVKVRVLSDVAVADDERVGQLALDFANGVPVRLAPIRAALPRVPPLCTAGTHIIDKQATHRHIRGV